MQNMQLLADPKKIQAFLNDLKNSNHISIDIEFMRRNTYFPEPCVMQISNGKIHTCIDLALEIDYKELLYEIFFSNKQSLGANTITGTLSSTSAIGPCFISPEAYPSACM